MKLYLPLAMALLLAGCQAPPSGGIGTLLQPNTNDSLTFPVYSDFADIVPLFEQTNDTTYVINFWATWCKPCVEEMPYFETLATEHVDDPLRIVMISLDFPKDVRGRLYDFVVDRPLDLPVVSLVDTRQGEWIEKVDPEWGGAIPVTVIYKNGLRYFVDEQFSTYQELNEMVEKLL